MKAAWVDICGGCDAAVTIQYTSNLWFTRMLTHAFTGLNRERKCADTYWHSAGFLGGQFPMLKYKYFLN